MKLSEQMQTFRSDSEAVVVINRQHFDTMIGCVIALESEVERLERGTKRGFTYIFPRWIRKYIEDECGGPR